MNLGIFSGVHPLADAVLGGAKLAAKVEKTRVQLCPITSLFGACLQNLQGLQIDELNHGSGASIELKGLNTLGDVRTEADSEISLEDNEDGEGTTTGTLESAGNLTTVGNHKFTRVDTLAGSKIMSHGQRTERAAAPVEELMNMCGHVCACSNPDGSPCYCDPCSLQNLQAFII